MSFLKSLFGGGSVKPKQEAASEDYRGYRITAGLGTAGNEYQVAGSIEKEINGELKRYEFIRADRLTDRAMASQMTLAKGRQIIDEQGDAIFR
jgi:hypothetical protein